MYFYKKPYNEISPINGEQYMEGLKEAIEDKSPHVTVILNEDKDFLRVENVLEMPNNLIQKDERWYNTLKIYWESSLHKSYEDPKDAKVCLTYTYYIDSPDLYKMPTSLQKFVEKHFKDLLKEEFSSGWPNIASIHADNTTLQIPYSFISGSRLAISEEDLFTADQSFEYVIPAIQKMVDLFSEAISDVVHPGHTLSVDIDEKKSSILEAMTELNSQEELDYFEKEFKNRYPHIRTQFYKSSLKLFDVLKLSKNTYGEVNMSNILFFPQISTSPLYSNNSLIITDVASHVYTHSDLQVTLSEKVSKLINSVSLLEKKYDAALREAFKSPIEGWDYDTVEKWVVFKYPWFSSFKTHLMIFDICCIVSMFPIDKDRLLSLPSVLNKMVDILSEILAEWIYPDISKESQHLILDI